MERLPTPAPEMGVGDMIVSIPASIIVVALTSRSPDAGDYGRRAARHVIERLSAAARDVDVSLAYSTLKLPEVAALDQCIALAAATKLVDEIGEWRVASGEWRVASGEWRVASGEWRVASGEWRVASGEWRAYWILKEAV